MTGQPCKDEYHTVCLGSEPTGDTLKALGGGRWIQCGGCSWWVRSPFQPSETPVTDVVEHDITHDAAPGIRTNQTVRELVEKEKSDG